MDRAAARVRQDRLPAALDRLCLAGRSEARHDRDQPRRLQDGDGDQRLQPDRRSATRPAAIMNDRAAHRHDDLLRRREGRARLQRDGHLQGGARFEREVSGLRLGPARHSRERRRARARLRTLAGRGAGVDDMLGLYEKMAPLGRNITHEEVGRTGAFCCRPCPTASPAKSCTSTAATTSWARPAGCSKVSSTMSRGGRRLDRPRRKLRSPWSSAREVF